ncbi:MAG: hypothetical protein PUD59_00130 [bacterium]|nr:hypothetical protein [bacterium]
MKFNKLFNILFLFFVILMITCFCDVYATELDNYEIKCVYNVVDKNNKKGNIYVYLYHSNFFYESLNFSYSGEGGHYISSDSYSRDSKLFVIENFTFYCPSYAYFCYDGSGSGSGRNRVTASASNCASNPAKITIDKSKSNGTVKLNEETGRVEIYEAKEKNGEIVACVSGGFEIYNNNIDEINKIEKNIDNAKNISKKLNDDINNQLSEILTNISGEFYCSKEITDLKNKIVELSNDLSKKVDESNNMTESEKKAAIANNNKLEQNVEKTLKNYYIYTDNDDPCEPISVEGVLDEDLRDVIDFVLKILKIAVPIGLIILITIDFSSAVISNDQDAIKKATSKAIKRAIAAVVIFFIPYIVDVLLDMPGVSSSSVTNTECEVDSSK